MKLLIVLCLCAAAMADLDTELVKQYVADCVKLTKLNPDDIGEDLKAKSELTQEQVDCFGACIDRKLNILDADGKFNMEGFLSYAPDEATKTVMREKMGDILEKCKEHEKDPCKLSSCLRASVETLQLSKKE